MERAQTSQTPLTGAILPTCPAKRALLVSSQSQTPLTGAILPTKTPFKLKSGNLGVSNPSNRGNPSDPLRTRLMKYGYTVSNPSNRGNPSDAGIIA